MAGSTTVLFAAQLTEDGCLCVRFSSDGMVLDPLMHRLDVDIQALQTDSNTVVVLSTERAGIHTVELPWLGERKARAAIPYALEEQLAQNVSQLHFAFDRAHHRDNRYLVAVMPHAWLADFMLQLTNRGIVFNELTLDWFALDAGEVAITPSGILVATEAYQGALCGALAEQFLSEISAPTPVLSFSDSVALRPASGEQPQEGSFFLWAARRLSAKPRLNLCQGDLVHAQPEESVSQMWIRVTAILASVWLLGLLGFKVLDIVRLNHQLSILDKQISTEYHQFFPDAQQVISPRFRIEQLLKTGHGSQEASLLWALLNRMESAFDGLPLTVEQLQFRGSTLVVTLTGNDFTALESLQTRLKQAKVKVSQTQAATKDGKVSASLELML